MQNLNVSPIFSKLLYLCSYNEYHEQMGEIYLKVRNDCQEFQVKQDLLSPLFHVQLKIQKESWASLWE